MSGSEQDECKTNTSCKKPAVADAAARALDAAAAYDPNAANNAALDPEYDQDLLKLSQKRADLRISLHLHEMYIDVSVICPTALSYVNQSIAHNLKGRENDKVNKYLKATGTQIIPLVFSTFGNPGKQVHKVFAKIKSQAVFDVKNFKRHAHTSTCFGVHRAVAQSALDGTSWVRSNSRHA